MYLFIVANHILLLYLIQNASLMSRDQSALNLAFRNSVVSIIFLCMCFVNELGCCTTNNILQSLYNTPHYNMDLDITWSCFGSMKFYKGTIGKLP